MSATNRTASPPFPLIDISGGPTERGRQYGVQAGDRILRSLEIYRNAFPIDWVEVRRIAARFVSEVEAFDPDLALELHGIARGAEQPVEDIIAINARTELLYGRSGPAADQANDGCTGAIALPGATADNHLLHGQNWDWRDECKDSAVVLRIEPEKGPRILTLVEAGVLGRCGLNSAGIGLTGNFLKCEADNGRRGVPVPFVRRRVLQAETFFGAISEVIKAPRSFSTNVMVSHAGGEAIDFEATPDEVFWIQPADGLVVHANHFVSPGALAKVKDVGLAVSPDSLYRHARVERHLAARRGRIDVSDLKAAFADDYGSPFSVCRSPVQGPGGENVSTVASVVMDVSVGKMWVAATPYAGAEYREYSLD